MAAGKGKQLWLLFWKNWIIQRRKVCCTVTEILVPVALVSLLALLRLAADIETIDDPTTWEQFTVDNLLDTESITKVAFTPDNDVTSRIMASAAEQLNISAVAFNSEGDLRDTITQEDGSSTDYVGGVVFTSSFDSLTLASHVKYKIRLPSHECRGSTCDPIYWLTETQFSRMLELGPRENGDNTDGTPGYFSKGFLQLQLAVDRAIVEEHSGLNTTSQRSQVQVELQRQPYPPYILDPFIIVLQNQFPLFIMIIFLCTAPCITKDVVLEKERKLKETMKLMGLEGWLHWVAWFLKYFIFLLIPVLLMSIIYKVPIGDHGSVIHKMDGSLFFVFILIYMISVIMFSFTISVFFTTANVGAAACGIIFYLTYIPNYFITPNYDTMGLGVKMVGSLLPNVAMSLCCVLIGRHEATGVGQQWSNVYRPVNVSDDLPFLYPMLMMLLDILLYAIIIWYVEAIKPGDFGVPQPWYFPFTKWYWCGTPRQTDYEFSAIVNLDRKQHEPLPEGVPAGIQIRQLRKVFKQRGSAPRVAVDKLDLDMGEGQITVLLGHNGAGKTTTMFMLTGFLEPTDGNAVIGGNDIRRNLNKVRENLGLCPQHDVLFDVLTVREHLLFFAQLKGSKDIEKDVSEMIDMLHLGDKTNTQAQRLSGGMKRKLCVGIALIGGSKIIILDEPTSGMDPEARRQTWELLQRARKGRTVLLTTHFMDEADYLGDRIAIMASGKLVTSGTSLFLKKRYGVGYHMGMVKKAGCDSQKVKQVVREYVPEAGVESDAGNELSFVLPHESAPRFPYLFTRLDADKEKLGISSWGASVTTMEEVFLKVGEEEEEKEAYVQENNIVMGADNPALIDPKANQGNITHHAQTERNTGIKLWGQQLWAMFFKRILYTWRSPVVNAVQLLVPFIFALIGCLVKNAFPDEPNAPSLTLKFSNYDNPLSAYKGVGDVLDPEVTELSSTFRSYARSQSVEVNEVSTGDSFSYLEDYLIDRSETNLETYINSEIVSAYFDDNGTGYDSALRARGLFNNEAIHSAPLALNSISNTLLRYHTNTNSYRITTTNHPLPLPASLHAQEDLSTSATVAFTIAFLICFGMSFLIATFVVFLVKERQIKAKHCQYTSGVPSLLYWAGTFFWDLINYIIPCLAILILFGAFNIEGYVANNNLGVVFLLFLLYGISVLPFVYLISFGFEVAATAYTVVVIINIISGTLATLAVFVLKIIATDTTKSVAEILEWIFYIFLPNFCFANGLQEVYNNYIAEVTCNEIVDATESYLRDLPFLQPNQTSFDYFCDNILRLTDGENPCCPDRCGDSCSDYKENYFDWESPGIGRPVLFMILQAIAYFLIIFLIETSIASRLKQKLCKSVHHVMTAPHQAFISQVGPSGEQILIPLATPVATEDEDVAAERKRVETSELAPLINSETLLLRNITKFYGGFKAVDKLSIGIQKGECFGLLGVNGAGKTTTFKMLTGDETITDGQAYVMGHNVAHNIRSVQQQVGYCPQFDALIDKLTVRETLVMFARLRGIPEANIKSEVNRLIQMLLLTEYKSKPAGNLSGGNKRKLSTAIALIGGPPLVFLDEPTTGMDPLARRQLWNTLDRVREAGSTIVLTSHSMEECEALCTRMVIMVNGQFKCTGSAQHLKDKFGDGFALTAKVTPGEHQGETQQRTLNLMMFVKDKFPDSVLKDTHPGLVLYQVSAAETSLAQIFGVMEQHKTELCIEDYSVSQTTLEQVFINFARAQAALSEPNIGCRACSCFCCCQ